MAKKLTQLQTLSRINLKSSKYWQEVFESKEEDKHKECLLILLKIKKLISRSMKEIEREFKDFYIQFAKDDKLTLQEVRKYLTPLELRDFKDFIEEYIDIEIDENIHKSWKRELERTLKRDKITRRDALLIKLGAITGAMYIAETNIIKKRVVDIALKSYYESAYEVQKGLTIGYPLYELNAKKVADLIPKSWTPDNYTFSERIWGKYRPTLNRFLENEFTQALMKGENPKTLAGKLAKRTKATVKQSETLLLTEASYFYSEGQKQCFEALGVELYELVATLDTRTSKLCRSLDGTVVPMKDYKVGVTAPPFHARCRTVTSPYFEDEVKVSRRIYRDADGNVGYVPATMHYEEWYEEYVKEK